MKASDFEFHLPEKLIAHRPLTLRDSSRLLVLERDGMVSHTRFSDFPSYLAKGDMLLINNTKVFPARLTGMKPNGDPHEILLVREKGQTEWEILSRGKYTGPLTFSERLKADIFSGDTAVFDCQGIFIDILWECGGMPLPPYIRRPPDEMDKQTYQSVFAKKTGSIAAPTASLHFTRALLDEIIARGVCVKELTLHVGIGTFKPIRTDEVGSHRMDSEHFEFDRSLVSDIDTAKAAGKRIISVGTTTTRAIEGFMSGSCTLRDMNGKFAGTTDMFIYPGYTFKAINSLLTNFHLPRSTPLMLASALAGRKRLLNAYQEAIARGYRFLSYGDAMLIL
jgi:S-adenosylmethionine:tRNA ribosyltransferase-isomerase